MTLIGKSLVAASFSLLAVASSADYLILRDGTRLETRGAPRVEGRRVTFTDAKGSLVALAASEVDFAATEAANREGAEGAGAPGAAVPPGSPVTPKRAPVLRLTDADVSHVDDLERPAIVFYSASWCGWCRKSRALLDELGARYRELDVDQDPRARRAKNELAPGSGVPVISFGDILLTGYSERGIRRMVDAWREAERAAQTAHEASRRPAE